MVAAVGTTATTALDPARAASPRSRERHGLWLHVDAALAGTAMICPELRWMWEGVEHADSLVLNPHKWMGTGFDLSAYYVRDPEHLVRVMSTDPSYLRTAQDGLVRNLRDWGIPLGRRFRALKLWFLLREYGVEGLQDRVRRDLANAAWLRRAGRRRARLGAPGAGPPSDRVPASPAHGARPATRPRSRAHNLDIADAVNRGGRSYLTPSLLKGRQMIRVSIGAQATERPHVEELWRDLQEAAAR